MIKHIVMWRLKEEAAGVSRTENAARIKTELEALVGRIPEILELEVGINLKEDPAAADVVLVSTFNSLETLAAYAAHPDHQKVVPFIKEVVSDRSVVDYEG